MKPRRSLPWGLVLAALSAPSCYDAGGSSESSDGGADDSAGAGADCTNCGAQGGDPGSTESGGSGGDDAAGGSAGSAKGGSGASGGSSGSGATSDAGAPDGGEPSNASGGAGNEAGADSSGGTANTAGTPGEAGAPNNGGSTSDTGGTDTAGTGGTLAGTGGGGTGGSAGTAGSSNGGTAGSISTGEFVGYHEDDSEATSPLPNVTLKVTNDGPPVALADIRLRYYMEWEPSGTTWFGQGAWGRLDDPYVGILAHQILVDFEALSTNEPGATHAVIISVDLNGELQTGQSLTALFTIQPSQWDGIDKTNDYSYASHPTLVEWDRFTAHVGDRHVWGLLP